MLQGHRGAVTALHESLEDRLLATGSEDGSVRLWDLRTRRSVRRLAFDGTGTGEGVNCIGKRSGDWLVASGSSLFSFDIRTDARVLVNEPTQCLLTSADEINDVDCSPDGLGVVCGNDEGEVLCLWSGAAAKRSNRHSARVVTSTRFVSSTHVLSGGLDNRIVVSNVRSGKVVFHAELEHNAGTFNPPHVHGVDVLLEEQLACVAIGDGSVMVLANVGDAGRNWKRNWASAKRLPDAHLAACCCVRFVDSARVVSAGSDSVLCFSGVAHDEWQVLDRVALEAKPNAILYSKLADRLVVVADVTSQVKLIQAE